MKSLQIRPGWFLLFVAFVSTAFYFVGYYFSPHLSLSISLKDSWTNVAQTVIQAFGLLSLFFFWLERMNNDRWNRMRETLNLTWTTPYAALLKEIRLLEQRKVFNRRWQPMSEDELASLKQNDTAKLDVRNFLDHLEEIAAGQKLRIFEASFFESIWASILRKNFRFFEPFICYLRVELEQPNLYTDLGDVVNELEKAESGSGKKKLTGNESV